MLQRKNKSNVKGTRILHFIGAAYVDGHLWTNALEWNGYYKVNIDTEEAEFLGIFDYADIWEDKLFYQVLAYQKFIFYIPWFSDYLMRLNTETLDTKYWKLPENIILEIAKFRAAYIYDEKIFMFPHWGNDICIFNIQTETFECNQTWLGDFLKNVKWNEHDKFIQGCQSGYNVWLPNSSGNFIMKFNLSTYQHEIIFFPESEEKIIDIVKYRKCDLLVLTASGNVWKYNIVNQSKELMYKYSGEIKEPYRHILVMQNRFYLIPAKEKNIVELNNGKCKIITYPFDWDLQYVNVGIETIFNGYFQNKEKILLYPCLGNEILILEQESLLGAKIYEDIENRKEAIFKYLEDHPLTGRILNEQKVDWRLFLDIIAENKNKLDAYNSLSVVGIQIWNMMKGADLTRKRSGISDKREGDENVEENAVVSDKKIE